MDVFDYEDLYQKWGNLLNNAINRGRRLALKELEQYIQHANVEDVDAVLDYIKNRNKFHQEELG